MWLFLLGKLTNHFWKVKLNPAIENYKLLLIECLIQGPWNVNTNCGIFCRWSYPLLTYSTPWKYNIIIMSINIHKIPAKFWTFKREIYHVDLIYCFLCYNLFFFVLTKKILTFLYLFFTFNTYPIFKLIVRQRDKKYIKNHWKRKTKML